MRSSRKKIHLLSEAGWLILGKVASSIAMLVMVRLLTRRLDTAEYGKLALGLTICNLITQLIMGALGQGIGRYYSLAINEGGYNEFFKSATQILKKAGLLILCSGILCVLIAVLVGKIEFAILASSLFAFSYVTGLNDISNGLQNLARNRIIAVRNATLELLIRLPIVASILFLFRKSAEAVVIGYLISGLILTYVQKVCIKKLRPVGDRGSNSKIDWQAQIFNLSIPASIWGIFVWLQQASDKWMLQAFTSIHDVAQYAVIYQIGYTPLITFMGILTTLFTPIIYQKATSNHVLVYNLLLFIAFVTVFGAAISWIFCGRIIGLLASGKYLESAHFLPYMVLAAGFYSAGDILCIKMMGDIRTKEIMSIKIIASLMGVALNILGASILGLNGVVYGAILFGIIYMLLFAVLFVKSSPNWKVSHV